MKKNDTQRASHIIFPCCLSFKSGKREIDEANTWYAINKKTYPLSIVQN